MKNKQLYVIGISALLIVIIMVIIFIIPAKKSFAYVDVNVIMKKYHGMIQSRSKLEQIKSSYQANIDSIVTGFEADLKYFEKERVKMTKKEIELKEHLLRNRQDQIEKYTNALEKKAREDEMKITQTSLNEINDFITEIGKKHKYTYVFGANGNGSLLYANPSNDITDEVIEGLNNWYNSTHTVQTEKK